MLSLYLSLLFSLCWLKWACRSVSFLSPIWFQVRKLVRVDSQAMRLCADGHTNLHPTISYGSTCLIEKCTATTISLLVIHPLFAVDTNGLIRIRRTTTTTFQKWNSLKAYKIDHIIILLFLWSFPCEARSETTWMTNFSGVWIVGRDQIVVGVVLLLLLGRNVVGVSNVLPSFRRQSCRRRWKWSLFTGVGIVGIVYDVHK